MSEEKYRFIAEWYDPTIQSKRKFFLTFFPSDGSVDMYDIASKRLFLRRMKCESVTIHDLFIGSVINVLSRQLFIVDFGDKTTAEKFVREVEPALFIVNESGFGNLGKILSVLEKNDLAINRGKIVEKDEGGFSSSSLVESLQKRFAAFELRGQNALKIVRKLLVPELPIEKPLSADLGGLSSDCTGPTKDSQVDAELKIFFPPKESHCNTAVYSNSTCCIIKPHAVREKLVGRIIQDIIDGRFTIVALRVVSFNLSSASEFYEVYKGVVAEYKCMVSQLMSGPSIALEVTKKDDNAFYAFRTHAGPVDPEIAQKLRAGTLRASYGQDKVKNAVHCTDLPEDTTIELEYVFRVMSM